MTEALLATLSRLAGPQACAAVEPVTGPEGLFPVEARAVRKAIPKRQGEFAAGRRAARRALASLGHDGTPIPAQESRAPDWPPGIVGAITHDNGVAAALVADAATCSGIGLDLAEDRAFPENLRDRILISQAERALSDIDARAVFSAKETLFKALYPSVQSFFGFEAAEVTPDLQAERFTARLTQNVGNFPAQSAFTGGLAIAGDHLVTTLVLAR